LNYKPRTSPAEGSVARSISFTNEFIFRLRNARLPFRQASVRDSSDTPQADVRLPGGHAGGRGV